MAFDLFQPYKDLTLASPATGGTRPYLFVMRTEVRRPSWLLIIATRI